MDEPRCGQAEAGKLIVGAAPVAAAPVAAAPVAAGATDTTGATTVATGGCHRHHRCHNRHNNSGKLRHSRLSGCHSSPRQAGVSLPSRAARGGMGQITIKRFRMMVMIIVFVFVCVCVSVCVLDTTW